MNWFLKRLREPSTMIGLGVAVGGIGQVAKIEEAPAIAETLVQSAPAFAGGDYVTGIGLLLGGVFGAFMKEKGDR